MGGHPETICGLSRAAYFPKQVILPVTASVQSSRPTGPHGLMDTKYPFWPRFRPRPRPMIMQGAMAGWGERVRTEEGHFLLQKILSNSKKIT